MGNSLNYFNSRENNKAERVSGNKRKRDECPELNNAGLELLNTPKRKRIKSTSKYIYQTLFLDGENSDVTLHVLGQEWKLHKLYLKQSPYFASMFSGAWKESDMPRIELDIIDENITCEALKIAFGSLYKDDVFIKPVQLTSVIATATLLQLEGLLLQCQVMMKDTLSSATVCDYYYASCSYGLKDVSIQCLDWLTRNILIAANLTFIKDVTADLMKTVIASPHLVVIQVEIDLYTLLKKWIFLIHNKSWTGDNKDLVKATDLFYKEKQSECPGLCYLETDEGRQYVPVFSAVRWHHVVNDLTSLRMIENEKILPHSWLEPMFLYGWRRVLAVEQGHDKGPIEKVDNEVFNTCCARFGRLIHKAGEYCWRWIGYSYGVDLLLSITSGRLVTVKRNTHTQACSQAVSLQDQRYIAYRLTICSFDCDGKELSRKSTDVKHISLGKDEEEIALVLDSDQKFPISVSMNVLLISPGQEPLPGLKYPNR